MTLIRDQFRVDADTQPTDLLREQEKQQGYTFATLADVQDDMRSSTQKAEDERKAKTREALKANGCTVI